jgi:hypothetical protein
MCKLIGGELSKAEEVLSRPYELLGFFPQFNRLSL